jgi:DNA modification methylase
MELNKIYNEDCLETMRSHIDAGSIDIVLTSPPYNTSRKGSSLDNACENIRYDIFNDCRTNEEYCQWTVDIFNAFDRVLKANGCVLYNMSYSSENTECMFLAVADIIRNTPFTVADTIIWKKKSASPNSCSSNKLTRICEYVFVFCRKTEFATFKCNKAISSLRNTGQKSYVNIFNYIEAANNDGSCDIHKATYSTELCYKLLGIYGGGDLLRPVYRNRNNSYCLPFEKDTVDRFRAIASLL